MEEFPDRRVKPFRTQRIPKFAHEGEELALKDSQQAERHADALGAQLFQHVADILDTLRALSSDGEYRKRISRGQAALFESVEALGADGREAALELADFALCKLVESVASTLECGEGALPGGYCLEYSLESRLQQITGASANGVQLRELESCSLVSRQGDASLVEGYPRWLRRYRERSNGG
jgi:hypothetical protein